MVPAAIEQLVIDRWLKSNLFQGLVEHVTDGILLSGERLDMAKGEWEPMRQ